MKPQTKTRSSPSQRKTMKPMSMRSLVYAPDSNPLLEHVTVTAKQRRVNSTLKGIHYNNADTGEVSEASVVHAIEEKDDAEFVKIFGAGVAAVYGLGKTAQRVFYALLREYERTPLQGGYADSIYLAWFGDGLCGRDVGMSEKTWQRGMQELMEKGFIAPQRPNVFWVNPALFFKGNRLVMVREYVRKRAHPATEQPALPEGGEK